jgi:hypothetical protein
MGCFCEGNSDLDTQSENQFDGHCIENTWGPLLVQATAATMLLFDHHSYDDMAEWF